MPYRVAIAVARGFTDSGLSIAVDIFRTADSLRRRRGRPPLFHVQVVSSAGGPVGSASGLRLAGTLRASAAAADVVIVPGVWVESPDDVDGVLKQPEVRRLVRAIKAAADRGAAIGSSCAGAFLLAEAGLLDHRRATTTWWLAPLLARRYPAVTVDSQAALVITGGVVTAGAVFAQADLCLHFVSRLGGPALARECASVLLLDRHASQTAYMAMGFLGSWNPRVGILERWVRHHLSERLTVDALARTAGVSPRTLARQLHLMLGMTPVEFLQRIRVEAALRMLETTPLSLEQISSRVGYADVNSLRRILRRALRASPLQLRRRVQSAQGLSEM